jgi:Na+-transporting methylmalonyl-CoA/oxaloacetate decarboxylase gamma subunit
MQVKVPIIAILLTILSITIAIIFFQILATISNQASKNAQQLEQLKKSIQESKKQAEQNIIKETKTETAVAIDYETEAKLLIPKENFENEEKFLEKLLSNISHKHDIVQAIAFKKDIVTHTYTFQAAYAFFSESEPPKFTEGETLPGQVAKNKVTLNLNDVPEDYITIISGLGKGSPKHLLILPILNSSNECMGIIELASFKEFDNHRVKLFETLVNSIYDHLLTIGNSSNI